MKPTHKHSRILFFSAFSLIAASAGIVSYTINSRPSDRTHSAAPSDVPCVSDCASDDIMTESGSSPARRLQERLRADGKQVPSIAILSHALSQRSSFDNRTVDVQVSDSSDNHAHVATWTVDFAKHPELITLRSSWSSASYGIDRDMLSDYMKNGVLGDAQSRTSIVLDKTQAPDKEGVVRAKDTPIARNGFDYDVDAVASAIEKAVRTGSSKVTLDLAYGTGSVTAVIGGKTRELQLLSSGRSNFTGSPDNRIWNVRKAVNERVNNIIIQPGAQFSFVDSIDTPVTLDKGWVMGLGLFGGGAAMTPGAGICQAATTTYRAALLAGLPIVEKRSHSMFVDHYEPYGVGLDATIFPGFHDMRFKNDTSDILLLQAFITGDDVTVNIYGIADGRTVALDGPYFNSTPNRNKELRPLGYDEIGWVDTVTYADGKTVTKPIVATYYKGYFKSVKTKYSGLPGKVLLSSLVPDPGQKVAATQTGGTVAVAH